jgi:F0F1-type ATP synthase membrane subunit b/b'
MSPPDRIDQQAPDEREALLHEIETTREELGATVEALAQKADVKAQVHHKVEETKEHLHEKVDETKGQLQHKVEETRGHLRATKHSLREKLDNPAVPGAIAAVSAVLLLVSVLRRRR